MNNKTLTPLPYGRGVQDEHQSLKSSTLTLIFSWVPTEKEDGKNTTVL